MMLEKIALHHLERKAILYVHQPSDKPVVRNPERDPQEFSMRDRLAALGWPRIESVGDDHAGFAAGDVSRAGFDRLFEEVRLGKVGAVATRQLSEFARKNLDWRRLVDMCRVVDTVLVDEEMVYAPRRKDDLLLLGLRGDANEDELDLLRQRSLSALYEKTERGELAIAAPVGFVKVEGRLEKDPDRRVQEAIALVFDKMAEHGNTEHTLLWFLEHGLDLPTKRSNGKVTWSRPRYATICRMVENPIYGGAYVCRDARVTLGFDPFAARQPALRKKPAEGLALVPDAHEGYLSWERAVAIRRTVGGNPGAGGRHGLRHADDVTEPRLPGWRRDVHNRASAEIIEAVRQFVLVASDRVIAGILNRNGLLTGQGNRWTRERVAALRLHHGVPVFRPAADGLEPWLNLDGAAQLVGVTPDTLQFAAEAGEIEGRHPLSDGPWIFSRTLLGTAAAQGVVQRIRRNLKYFHEIAPDQQNLIASNAWETSSVNGALRYGRSR